MILMTGYLGTWTNHRLFFIGSAYGRPAQTGTIAQCVFNRASRDALHAVDAVCISQVIGICHVDLHRADVAAFLTIHTLTGIAPYSEHAHETEQAVLYAVRAEVVAEGTVKEQRGDQIRRQKDQYRNACNLPDPFKAS